MFALLRPGRYTLRVEKSGFHSYVQSGIVFTAGQTAMQNVTLDLGQARQRVAVTAGAAMLNITTANVGTTVVERRIVEFPLDVRNVFAPVSLNASVNSTVQMTRMIVQRGDPKNKRRPLIFSEKAHR